MRKNTLLIISLIFFLFFFSIIYLSVYGVKTDKFNNFINDKLKEYNSKLTLQLDDVYIKLNLNKSDISINSKNANLIAENNLIKISNIDISLNLFKFLKNENSIINFKIKSSKNIIKDVTSFLNILDYDLSRYIFYSQIKQGFLYFELETHFNNINQKLDSYFISGSITEAKINLPGYGNLNEINFDFVAQDKKINISNLKITYDDVKLFSKSLEITEDKKGIFDFKGDIENNKILINPNLIFRLANVEQDFLSNEKVPIQSKNIFSFKFNRNKKIKNLKIDSVINFDELYFSNFYKNLIFLKDGKVKYKYEDKKFTADLVSNFIFSDDLQLSNEYKKNNLNLFLESKNSQVIEAKGNISNKKTPINSNLLLSILKLDHNLISSENLNIGTDSDFKFKINKNKIENYVINSNINLDELKFNKKIQDLLYLKNVKSKLTFSDKFLKLDLKSYYSFINQNYNNDKNNIIKLNLYKPVEGISDLEIFLKTDNNKINTKEFKKYFKRTFIEDQIVNLNSSSSIYLSFDEAFNIVKIAAKSDIKFDNLNINYKSNVIKKYIKNYENKLTIKNPNILLKYSNDKINLQLDGRYKIKNLEDNIFINFQGNKQNFELYSLLNLDKSTINIGDIQYFKKKNIPSKLEILINNSKKGLNFKKIIFSENENYISFKNLRFTDDFKIKGVDQIDANFFNKNKVLNKFQIKKNSTNYDFIGSHIDGEKIIETLLNGKSKSKISKLFSNVNTSLVLSINKIHLEKNSYLEKFDGELDIKNNKLFLGKINAILSNKNKFSYSFRTTNKNEKITNIFIERPKPFINNYKFIKGFEEGELQLNSVKIDSVSRSNLKITNFKVKEVPVLAKILTLASLQGIADLLTGEGIRFDEFEMDFKTKNNLTEIDEMYALGPAISIMMEGYIEKNRVTSLRGTLVPATTINKTIAKIPLIGELLVGNKTGEGVFGVSFKIKGSPDNLKSTVNPIKTLTPRFITRTLENIKGN